MSRIEELLERLSPAGVTFVRLGEVVNYVRGLTYSKNDELPNGPIKVLRSNNITLSSNTLNFDDVKAVSGFVRARQDQRLYADDILISAASGSKAHVGKVAYIGADIDYYFGGFMAVLRTTGGIQPRFLFHLLIGAGFADYLQSALTSTTINNLSASIIDAFRVPVPPLEVQTEIVRILDRFTELEAQLEAELEAEVEARRVQFEFYRDSLLANVGSFGSRRMTMGELGTFFRGRRFVKSDAVPRGIPSIHYGDIYTRYGTSATEAALQVREDLAGQLRFAEPGDVVIASVGETVEDVAKAVAWIGTTDVAIHDDTFAFRSDADATYIAFAMQTAEFHSQKSQYVARAKVKRLSSENLAKIVIPVPPLEDQRRIVRILNEFVARLDELSIALPAELVARRKQYGYYRDKLLTFQEAF